MQRMKDFFKNFFKERRIGFYFTMLTVLLALIQLIVYCVAFTDLAWVSYMHWTVVFFSVLAIVSGIALSVPRVTARFAPVAATLFSFLSFLMFARYGYMYFSQIFFSGFTMSLFFQMYYGYLGGIILYVLAFVSGTVAIFTKQSGAKQEKLVKEEA